MSTGDEIYITCMEAHNWQSHKDTTVHLVNGINAFIGTSNSGKSSLLRLIEWVLKNTPSGSDFIRLGQDECWGAITFSTGYRIRRARNRTGTTNTYEIFKDGVLQHEAPLTGFGTSVPLEVVDAIGMGDMEFTFSKQMDAPFLISASPKVRAETIGNLDELGKIDKALESTNTDIRDDGRTLKALDTEVKKLEKEADELRRSIARDQPRIDMVRLLKRDIEAKEQTKRLLDRSVPRLSAIAAEMEEVHLSIARADRILSVWDDGLPDKVAIVQRLRQHVPRLQQIMQELVSISFLSDETMVLLASLSIEVDQKIQVYGRLDRAVKRLSSIAMESDQIASSYSPKIADLDCLPLDRQIESFRVIHKNVARLKNIQTEMSGAQQQVTEATKQIDSFLEQFVEALQKEKVCPTCAQSTEHVTCEHAKQII